MKSSHKDKLERMSENNTKNVYIPHLKETNFVRLMYLWQDLGILNRYGLNRWKYTQDVILYVLQSINPFPTLANFTVNGYIKPCNCIAGLYAHNTQITQTTGQERTKRSKKHVPPWIPHALLKIHDDEREVVQGHLQNTINTNHSLKTKN